MHNLYKVLLDLDTAKIHYTLARYRDDTVTIHVTVPGQRIEIDVESDGTLCTSTFSGSENVVLGIDIVNEIIEKFSD